MIEYPKLAGELSFEERDAIYKELYPESEGFSPWCNWEDDKPLTRREQRAWFRYVHRPPDYPRWEQYPAAQNNWSRSFPRDAILWALCMRREREARRLLERKGRLSWAEGTLYAPWTFGWSQPLLRLILDMSPQAGELGCARTFRCPGGGGKMIVLGNLLMGAAALNDLPAAELLLERDYSLGSGDFCRKGVSRALHDAKIEPFGDEYLGIQRAGGERRKQDPQEQERLALTDSYAFFTCKHRFHLVPDRREGSPWEDVGLGLNSNDALAAACLCGHREMALLLLRKSPFARESLDFRKALADIAAEAKSPRLLDCLRAVEAELGMSAVRFVEPSECECRRSEFFQECLRIHDFYGFRGEFDMTEYMVESPKSGWVLRAAPFAPRERLFSFLCEALPDMPDPDWFCHPEEPVALPAANLRAVQDFLPLMTAVGLRCTLDRNCVPQSVDLSCLFGLLEYVELVGEPPETGLSGVAQAILWGMSGQAEQMLRTRQKEAVFLAEKEKALTLLRQEDPRYIVPYLERLEFSRQSKLFLLSLLPEDLRCGQAYDL